MAHELGQRSHRNALLYCPHWPYAGRGEVAHRHHQLSRLGLTVGLYLAPRVEDVRVYRTVLQDIDCAWGDTVELAAVNALEAEARVWKRAERFRAYIRLVELQATNAVDTKEEWLPLSG